MGYDFATRPASEASKVAGLARSSGFGQGVSRSAESDIQGFWPPWITGSDAGCSS
jgi:hypothetical protein